MTDLLTGIPLELDRPRKGRDLLEDLGPSESKLFENTVAAIRAPKDISLFQSTKNEFFRGHHMARQARQMLLAVASPSTLSDFADDIVATRKAIRDIPTSKDLQEFQEAETFGAAAKTFITNPLDVAIPLLVGSLVSFGETAVPLAGAGAAVGAGAGVAGGPFAPVTVPVGARIGAALGTGVGSLLLEASGEFFSMVEESIVKAGDDPDSADAWRKHLANKQLVSEARSFALKKGVPVAILDALSVGIAGRLTALAKTGRKAVTATGEVTIQSALGAGGEALGQLASEGKITSPGGILAEAVLEIGPGAIEVAAGTALELSRGAKAKSIAIVVINGKERDVTQEQVDRILSSEGTPSRNDLRGVAGADKLSASQRAEIKSDIQEQIDGRTQAQAQEQTAQQPTQAAQEEDVQPQVEPRAQEEVTPVGTAQVQALDRSTGEITDISVAPENTVQALRDEHKTRGQIKRLQDCLSRA